MYQLTEFQYGNLLAASNNNSICFAVLESNPTDTPDRKEKFDAWQKETDDLIGLGLVRDVSEKFTEAITLSRMNNKRGYRVMAITEDGLRMFHDCENRAVN